MSGQNPAEPREPETRGRCHCGAAGWRLRGAIVDATICNCTICRRTGGVWAYGFDGEEITVDDPDGVLVSYAWGHRTIAYRFCGRCGTYVSWRALAPLADGRTRAAVNLRLAEPASVAAIPVLRFDGLVSFEDLPPDGRRVGDVVF